MRKPHRTAVKGLSLKAKVVGLTVGAALTWLVISISLATAHGDSSADMSAADYAGISQAAASAAAEQRVQNGDAAGARIFARRALSMTPISASSLRSLALSEQMLGNNRQAAALFSQAAALGWRDVPTQLWLFRAFMENGDDVQASQRLDAVLRTSERPQALFSSLDQLIADPQFAHAIVERLAANPAWRRGYFMTTEGVSPAALVSRGNLLHDLMGSSAPPTRDEVRLNVTRLIQAGYVQQAHALWLETQRTAPNTTVYDPHFTHAAVLDNIAFEWILMVLPGADASVSTASNGTSGLEIKTDGSASGTIARQMIVLPAGDHRLSYEAEISNAGRNAFAWTIRCASDDRLILDSSMQSAQPYRFSVPEGCESQYVELRAKGSSSVPNNVATFNNLRIE